MADISYLQNEDVEHVDDREMSNSTANELRNCEYDQRDNDGDGGGGDEGGGLHSLDGMAKLQQYASCEMSYNRQLVGRILVEIFRAAVDNETELNVAEVIQPLYKLVNDTDANVRQELVEQLPHVAMICQEDPERFGNVLSDYLIRIIVNFHHDDNQQVRQSTHIALLKLIERGLLDKESAEFIVAPTLLRMPLLPAKLEYHRAIDGMSKVASVLDPETAERLFFKRYLMLCRDDDCFIRKSCALHFGDFAAAMTKETLYELLLPVYEILCEDPMWSVRKSCVDAMVSVACCVSLEYRRTTLSQILAKHLNDYSKWVRLSAFQILGPFITTFAKHFTGFAYKQYGELVLTDQYGTELRYNLISFLGMGDLPTSCTATSDEDFVNDHERLNPQSETEHSLQNVKILGNTTAKYTSEVNKENVPIDNTSKIFNENNSRSYTSKMGDDKLNFDDTNKSSDSHDLYNPFLYYYIPPNLPLDQELVDAATSENKLTNKISQNNDHSNVNELPLVITNKDEVHDVKLSKTSKLENELTLVNKTDGNKELKVNCSELSDEILNEKNDTNNTINISSISSDESDSMNEMNTKNIKYVLDKDGQRIVPQELIDFFVSMAEPEAYYDLKWNSVEIPRFCAFCFPAVVLTLGKENWPILKTAYKYLSGAREYRVRRTMASSIHEVAKILGEELSAKDLLPIYDGFIKDLDEVRIGALKHLATFLEVLKPEYRNQFLPRLQAFLSTDNEWNWRFREEVASQYLQIISLYTTDDVVKHIVPLSFRLLVDKVSAVRQMALKLITEIIAYSSNDRVLVPAIIQDLRLMLTANTSRWTGRQTFALLCASLLKYKAISGEDFIRELLPSLLKLASDVVPNVRLAVIRALSVQVFKIKNLLTPEQIEKFNQEVAILSTDRDRDVRNVASKFLSVDCQSLSSLISTFSSRITS